MLFSDIVGCEHCQVIEDGEIRWGIGTPVSVSELSDLPFSLACPNCRAKLESNDFVMINIAWSASEKTLSARSEF